MADKINMLKHVFKSFLYLGIGLISICATAQNDDEREDDLGDVSDAFQEAFFEGLKQAAIENHEKAILAFTDCIEEDPENASENSKHGARRALHPNQNNAILEVLLLAFPAKLLYQKPATSGFGAPKAPSSTPKVERKTTARKLKKKQT